MRKFELRQSLINKNISETSNSKELNSSELKSLIENKLVNNLKSESTLYEETNDDSHDYINTPVKNLK